MRTLSAFISRHKLAVSIAAVLGITGAYFFFFQESADPSPVARTRTLAVEKGSLSVAVSGSGQIEAESRVDLKPVAAGDAILVTAVSVQNDQEVKKGQLIATIDSEDALRDVEQAELSLKSARIKMQQTENDFDGKNVEETLIRRAQEVSVKQQELALRKTLSKLTDYSIRAPFDGIVTGLSVESGDAISQTVVLASVITKELKAVVSLNEVDAIGVKVGDVAKLSFNALPNVSLEGVVSKIDTIGTASQGVVAYGAEITFDAQEVALKPGMSVTAEIIVAQKDDVLLVPNEALILDDGATFVRTVSGGRTAVETGLTDNVRTEVTKGLTERDQVVVTSGFPQGAPQANQGNVLNSLLRTGRTGPSR